MPTPKNQFSKEQAQSTFIYNNGSIYWREKKGKRVMSKPAGWVDAFGYMKVKVKGIGYRTHNIIYNYHNGLIPEGYSVDHIDRNTLNNNIINLRIATHSEQVFNRGIMKNNTSGVKGISFHQKRNRWVVRCVVDGLNKYFGQFKTLEEAISKRMSIKQ
jgi:hypothetical protein